MAWTSSNLKRQPHELQALEHPRQADVTGTISAAIVEQSSRVAQIEQAVSQMDQPTQQNAALVEQSSAAAESLKDKAREFVQAVAFFKIETPASRTQADTVDVSAYAEIAAKWANS
jgi:hypothetical protein